jgi:hypothetical protein
VIQLRGNVPLPTIQSLIEEAQQQGSEECDREFKLIVRVRTYGKADQCWKVVRRVMQACRLQNFGVRFFLMNDEEILDSGDGSTDYVPDQQSGSQAG